MMEISGSRCTRGRYYCLKSLTYVQRPGAESFDAALQADAQGRPRTVRNVTAILRDKTSTQLTKGSSPLSTRSLSVAYGVSRLALRLRYLPVWTRNLSGVWCYSNVRACLVCGRFHHPVMVTSSP